MATKLQSTACAKSRILLVDDDPITLDSLGAFLEQEGHDVTTASGAAQAVDFLKATSFDLVISEVNMPGGDGLELLRYAKRHNPDLPVVLATGYGSVEAAVEAIRQGALDYLTKPLQDDEVRQAIASAMDRQHDSGQGRPKGDAAMRQVFDSIVGSDCRMAKVFELMSAVADSRTTVLITGESGTGKSLIARAIHAGSPRCDKPFVEVSCGALPDTLLESELFGHLRGAFTHAMNDKPGKFAAANGGTIFLDEISSASPQLQVKLLRVLQERQFEPLGSNDTKEVDVRVILATNHNMLAEVESGRFRRDLYYRINVVNIELPPLRDRMGDIPLLAEHFLRKYLAGSRKSIQGFSAEVVELLGRYNWPGNVRELENCVERAVVLCRQVMIGPDDLPPAVLAGARSQRTAARSASGKTLHEALEGPQKEIIVAALEQNHQNRQATAAQLGINRTTLYKKMKKYGLL